MWGHPKTKIFFPKRLLPNDDFRISLTEGSSSSVPVGDPTRVNMQEMFFFLREKSFFSRRVGDVEDVSEIVGPGVDSWQVEWWLLPR